MSARMFWFVVFPLMLVIGPWIVWGTFAYSGWVMSLLFKWVSP